MSENSDSLLRAVADSIGHKDIQVSDDQPSSLQPYQLVIIKALDNAMETTGRSTTEVLYALLRQRYNLKKIDILSRPGEFMSALRDILGSSCESLENLILWDIRDSLDVRAGSIDDAVYLAKKKYSKTGREKG